MNRKIEIPKFGYMIHPARTITDELALIREHGFDFAELSIEPPFALPHQMKKHLPAIKKMAAFFPHPMVGHTAWWLDLGTEYPAIRTATITELKHSIDLCRALGIQFMNIHATFYGIYLGDMTHIALDNFASAIRELKRYADSKKVQLMIENTPKRHELSSFKSFEYLLKKTGVHAHVDVGHAFVAGGMDEIFRYIHLGSKIAHIHLHDNGGGSDDHLPLGRGVLDYESIIAELKKVRYSGTITFEVFTSIEDAVSSRETIRRMW